MRARYASVTASGEAAPLAKAAVSSWIVAWGESPEPIYSRGTLGGFPLLLLFDDLGHAKEVAAALRRVGERSVLGEAGAELVVAHHVDHGDSVGRRLGGVGVERAQRVDVGQDAVELLAHALALGLGQGQPRQARHVLDVLAADHCRGPCQPASNRGWPVPGT